MRRNWFAVGLAGTLTAVVLVAMSWGANGMGADEARGQFAATDRAAENDKSGPFGPPPWAHADKSNGKSADKGSDKGSDKAQKHAWKEAWKALTPAQREAKMAALAEQHAEGMRRFSACMEAAAGDAAKRAECTKPLPPGLAKKLP
ncbi:MAG TPA: hypothetical protein VLI04_09750 [Nocardioidaceae bacterium]|nr:hypothetical protein [Nocardioidaceae bacterium]